ncbi:MAG: translesion DNA synthesis-associated protein ImuA [Wenzhouxiangellaceae bacterium]
MHDALQQLLNHRSDLWRGRTRSVRQAIPTGHAALDALLPDGGWPCGRLIELLPERVGSGELELLLPMLAGQTAGGRYALFACPPLVPCPQRLAAEGVELSRLLVIRSSRFAAWSAEQALKSGLCGAVLFWPEPRAIHERMLRRLQLAAEQRPTMLFVCYPPGSRPPPSIATLRLAIHAGGEVRVLRHRHGQPAAGIRIAADNVIALHTRRRTAGR